MLITFNLGPSNADNNAKYMNFLRCITAACTATAGTTSLTVHPWTSKTNLNTALNCITSVDAHAEGGGWTTSSSHNVVDTGSFTDIHTNGNAFANYKADFFRDSGKSTYPFLKMSFHIPTNTVYNNGMDTTITQTVGGASSQNPTIVYPGSWNTQPKMISTYGHSTVSNWNNLNAWCPTNTITGHTGVGQIRQGQNHLPAHGDATRLGSSVTAFWDTATEGNQIGPTSASSAPSVNPWHFHTNQPTYRMAVTADYCIIWEINSAVATNSYSSTTGLNQSDNINASQPNYASKRRYGSIVYHGTRTVQNWETSYSDNPAWVSWSWAYKSNNCPIQNNTTVLVTTGNTGNERHYSNYVAAYMRTLTRTSEVNAATLRVEQDGAKIGNVSRFSEVSTAGLAGNPLTIPNTHSILHMPLFSTRKMEGRTAAAAQPSTTPFIINPPQPDPTTGLLVPSAYPLVIKSTKDNAYNAGGNVLGIFKSLSMPWADMKTYWTAGNQTFLINNEPYTPLVIRDEMWLVRAV